MKKGADGSLDSGSSYQHFILKCLTKPQAKLASAKGQFTRLLRKVSTNFGRMLR